MTIEETVPAAAALPLPMSSQGKDKLGDAHALLSNAADLPIAGFVRFVILP